MVQYDEGDAFGENSTRCRCIQYYISRLNWRYETEEKKLSMSMASISKKKTELKEKIGVYAVSIAIALGTGGLSALLSMGNMDLYSDIRQPLFAPPAILFPIVWTVLYILMGIGAAMIYTEERVKKSERTAALTPYAASLFVNFLWSLLFFNFRAFLPAFIWLVLLEFLVVMTIISYRKVNTGAAYLQIPYAIWVAFAGYLNIAIYLLNP